MRRQRKIVILIFYIIVLLLFVNFLTDIYNPKTLNDGCLENGNFSICKLTSIFSLIGKTIFIVDIRLAKNPRLENFLLEDNIELAVLNESGLSKLRVHINTNFVTVQSLKCTGTNRTGTLLINTLNRTFYIHIFVKYGDYYRICDVGLPDKFSFGDVNRSMDLINLQIINVNGYCQLLMFDNADQFLFNYKSSKFIECNKSSMEWVFKNYPEQWVNQSKIQEIIVPGLLELKLIGNNLQKRFFMSGSTLLGWYRQCGIIMQALDIDFAMFMTEYDNRVLNSFIGNRKLFIYLKYGLYPGPIEFRLSSFKYYFDLFTLTYDSKINSLIGIYQSQLKNYHRFTKPISEICSADLVGIRTLIPCNYLEIIENEYGSYPEWQIPVKGTNWHNIKFIEAFNESYLNCKYVQGYTVGGNLKRGSYGIKSNKTEC